MPFCQHCGNKIEPNANFCPKCGNQLNIAAASSQTKSDASTNLDSAVNAPLPQPQPANPSTAKSNTGMPHSNRNLRQQFALIDAGKSPKFSVFSLFLGIFQQLYNKSYKLFAKTYLPPTCVNDCSVRHFFLFHVNVQFVADVLFPVSLHCRSNLGTNHQYLERQKICPMDVRPNRRKCRCHSFQPTIRNFGLRCTVCGFCMCIPNWQFRCSQTMGRRMEQSRFLFRTMGIGRFSTVRKLFDFRTAN